MLSDDRHLYHATSAEPMVPLFFLGPPRFVIHGVIIPSKI